MVGGVAVKAEACHEALARVALFVGTKINDAGLIAVFHSLGHSIPPMLVKGARSQSTDLCYEDDWSRPPSLPGLRLWQASAQRSAELVIENGNGVRRQAD